jgi:hypothetical protein
VKMRQERLIYVDLGGWSERAIDDRNFYMNHRVPYFQKQLEAFDGRIDVPRNTSSRIRAEHCSWVFCKMAPRYP